MGRLLLRLVDGWIALLEALGVRGTRWEWRKRSWRTAAESKAAEWENLGRGARSTLRMCRSCRTLVEGGAATCPACGASMSGIPRGGMTRGLSLLFPGRPSVSVLILSANVLMAVVTLALDGWQAGALLNPGDRTLWVLGEKHGFGFAIGQWWRLLTANYLHGGIIHLFVNSMSLATLGPLIEEAFGGRRLFVLYTLAGISGFAASGFFRPGIPSVGASAAIFGLLGFAVVYGRYRAGRGARALSDQLTQWLIFGVVMSIIPRIDWLAHMGGLVPGLMLGFVFEPGPPRTPVRSVLLWVAALACLALTVWAFVAMVQSVPLNGELYDRST